MADPKDVGFELSISARGDGVVEAVYIRFRSGKARRTREVIEDVLLADYDSRGQLIGVEILAPVRVSEIAKLIDDVRRPAFRRFMRRSAPPHFLAA